MCLQSRELVLYMQPCAGVAVMFHVALALAASFASVKSVSAHVFLLVC